VTVTLIKWKRTQIAAVTKFGIFCHIDRQIRINLEYKTPFKW